MGLIRIAATLAVLTLSSSAWAGDKTTTEFDQTMPARLRLPASVIVSATATPASHSKKADKKSGTGCNQNGCGYKALLGELLITKDFQLSQELSVRMLPTNHALGGEDAKGIVVRPETKGESYYGVRVHAAF